MNDPIKPQNFDPTSTRIIDGIKFKSCVSIHDFFKSDPYKIYMLYTYRPRSHSRLNFGVSQSAMTIHGNTPL